MIPQRTGVVSLACLVGVGLTLVLVNTADSPSYRTVGLDFWNVFAAQQELQRHKAERDAINAQHAQLLRERDFAYYVAHRLIKGKISLVEAIDELEPMLRHRVGFECSWPDTPPPTFRHAVARYTMTRVEAELALNPPLLAIVSVRLQTEYAAIR